MHGSLSRYSLTLRIPLMLLVALMLVLGAAEGKKKKTAPPPTGLPAKINELAKHLYGVALEDSAPITSQIQKLVQDDLTEWMANRTPTDVEARRHLENDFSLLHYPLEGIPVSFAQPWKGQIVIGVGYTLGWSVYDRQNVLAIFVSSADKSHLVTVTDFIPRVDIHYQTLPQFAWDDLRFFVYGFRPGKSQPRLSVVLYSFDGHTLKSLWEKQDIYDGKIDFMNDKVVVRYLNEDEYVRTGAENRVPPRHMATYQLNAAGIQLTDEHDVPF